MAIDKKKKAKLIAAAVSAIIAIILVLQNTESVETHILFAKVEMPRAVLLLITFLLGFALGVLGAFAITGKKK
jgi:uncharacterized integral membrane protein